MTSFTPTIQFSECPLSGCENKNPHHESDGGFCRLCSVDYLVAKPCFIFLDIEQKFFYFFSVRFINQVQIHRVELDIRFFPFFGFCGVHHVYSFVKKGFNFGEEFSWLEFAIEPRLIYFIQDESSEDCVASFQM